MMDKLRELTLVLGDCQRELEALQRKIGAHLEAWREEAGYILLVARHGVGLGSSIWINRSNRTVHVRILGVALNRRNVEWLDVTAKYIRVDGSEVNEISFTMYPDTVVWKEGDYAGEPAE